MDEEWSGIIETNTTVSCVNNELVPSNYCSPPPVYQQCDFSGIRCLADENVLVSNICTSRYQECVNNMLTAPVTVDCDSLSLALMYSGKQLSQRRNRECVCLQKHLLLQWFPLCEPLWIAHHRPVHQLLRCLRGRIPFNAHSHRGGQVLSEWKCRVHLAMSWLLWKRYLQFLWYSLCGSLWSARYR